MKKSSKLIILPNGFGKIIDDKSYIVHPKNLKKAFHNDIVEFEIINYKNKEEAKITKIVERENEFIIGTCIDYCTDDDNDNVKLSIIRNKHINVDLHVAEYIPINSKVKIKYRKSFKNYHYCRLIEIIGNSFDHETEMNSIVLEYGFDTSFPQEVENEAALISEIIDTNNRKDYRNKITFTIDPVNAKDFDDALSVEEFKNHYEIGVHIADVSHYVKPNSKIDQEAYNRCTSVYLVDRTIPMLPERLSNDLCSLKPNVDRYAYSVIFKIDKKGKVLNYKIEDTVIHSNHRFTYEEALEIIEGKDHQFKKEIDILYSLSNKIRKKRNYLDMSKKEAKFKLNLDNTVKEIYFKEGNKATRLIEEFMLLANRHIGIDKEVVWRNHGLPNEDKLFELEEYVKVFGLDITLDSKEKIIELLDYFRDSVVYDTISSLVVRCMSKAKYDTVNIGHYGLDFEKYSHFTSPIRRYADLLTHRILRKHQTNHLKDKCNRINNKEVNAMRAERDSIAYKSCEYMQQFINTKFHGVVSYIYKEKCYIKLDNDIEVVMYIDRNELNTNYKIIHNNLELTIGTKVYVTIDKCDLFNKETVVKI